MQKKLSIIVAIALLPSACGYHLRGAYDLPKGMNNIYLDGGSSLFREQFVSVLNSSSGRLVSVPEQANIVLRVFNDNIERRTLSLSERGRSNDIELAGLLEYEVSDPKKGVLVSREPIQFRREYFNDQQDVIAKDNEETVIRKEMYQQVVRSIINRSRLALEGKGQ